MLQPCITLRLYYTEIGLTLGLGTCLHVRMYNVSITAAPRLLSLSTFQVQVLQVQVPEKSTSSTSTKYLICKVLQVQVQVPKRYFK